MRPKSGLPKRRALRNQPAFKYGFRCNPITEPYRNPALDGRPLVGSYEIVSLFAGCGGLDLGFLGGFEYKGSVFEALPFNIVHAADIDDRAVSAYRLNLSPHAHVSDLSCLPSSELPKARILTGGFPCQDFSSSGPKSGFSGNRGLLYRALVDYMDQHHPDVVVAENVPHLRTLHKGQYLRTILNDFTACGYEFDVWDIYCPDYGLSQSRRRLFLVGRRQGLVGFPEMPIPTSAGAHRPIEHAIDDLKSVTDEHVPNQSQYFVATRATSGGGQGDHTNQRGKLAYCIRANARARIQFHYELDRRLTVRECARLQSFPDEFVFPYAAMTNMSLIGNAVPPIVGYQVASSIAEYLQLVDSGTKGSTRSRNLRQRELFSQDSHSN